MCSLLIVFYKEKEHTLFLTNFQKQNQKLRHISMLSETAGKDLNICTSNHNCIIWCKNSARHLAFYVIISVIKELTKTEERMGFKWANLSENQQTAYAKTKAQISCAVTAELISTFVFATWIVQFLFYLNPKFQASSLFLWQYRPVCVGPCLKPRF